jgi:Holliday junction resolvase
LNKKYVIGRHREQYLKLKFKKQGWFTVRCAGSKPVDLILIRKGDDGYPIVRIIESKKSGYIKPNEKVKHKEIEKITGIKVEVI